MDEYIRKQNEKNKSAAMGGFEEASREREAAYKTAEQKSGEGFAELLRQMYADDYRRRAETDASLEARGLNTGAGSQASLEQASTLRQNERDMRLAEESARLDIETSRNAAEAEARAAVQKAIASADYNAANQLYENFKSERSSAQRQVDKLLAAGVMPDDGTISKSGYDLDYVKGLYTKNTAGRGGNGKSTFESIAEKAGQTIAAALKNPKGGNGSNKKGGTAATLILNNAMQKKDVNERQEYLLAAQAAGAITDKECGGMLLLTMQAPTFAKPKVTALQLGAIDGNEPIDRSEALKLKTAIFGNSPVALPTTVGEAKTMLTNAVVGSLAAEITARRKQSENMSAYPNAVYDDSAPTTSVQLKTQLDSGEITQDEIIARHLAADDYREKHFLTDTDGATVEDLFMQGYTEEQVDLYLTTRSKEQETADNEKALSNLRPLPFAAYDSDVENVIAGILARGRALWNNFLGSVFGVAEAKQNFYDRADRAAAESAAYLDAAKEGKGAFGKFAVDAAVVLSDVATDAAANFLVPGSGIVLMGVRSYEQGRMNGRQNGLDDGEQILYGLSTAGIEIATEKLFGGLKIAYGKGVADKAAGKAIAKITERLAETSAGKAVSKFASSGTGKVIAAAFGEGMEEVIADLLQPGVDVAFGLSEEYEVHLEDIVYDGLLGGFVGLLGGGANLAQNRLAQRAAETQTTYNTLAQGGVTAEQQRATMRSQDPSLSGALFSANNGAALMAEFERVKQGAKSGIAFAFNSLQQTGAVNTNEAAVTAAARSATEVGVVTESNSAASTVQAKAEPSAQEIAQAAAAIQASEAIITQAETERQEIEELHRNGSLSDESYKKRIRQIEKKIRKAERAANVAKSQLNIDNTVIRNYTESINDNVQGGLPNDGNRVDRGLAEEVPGGQYLGGNTQAGREWGSLQNGRGSQKLSRRDLTQSVKDVLKDSGVVAAELVDYSADSAAFSDALASARAVDGQNGWAVTPQSVDDLQGKKLFADANGTIGFAITPDGDIEAVFKNKVLNKTAHAMDGVMPQALALGGMKLYCYGDALVRVYERYGFTPVARVEFNPEYANEGWTIDKGTPYIYFMVHNGDSAETVAANIGKYSHMTLDELNALPTYAKDGYDEAYAYRDGLLQDSTVSPEYAAALEAVQQSDLPKGVGAAESGFTGPMTPIDQWVGEAQERGESYIHDVSNEAQRNLAEKQHRAPYDVPKYDKNGKLTRAGVETIINSGITDEATADLLMEEAYQGTFSYDRITDRGALRRVKAAIKKDGFETCALRYLDDSYSGRVTKDSQVMGIVLLNNAIANKDYNLAVKLSVALAEDGTNSAQALQARRMLNKLSPEGRLYAVTQIAERVSGTQREKIGEKRIEREADKIQEAVERAKETVTKNYKAAAQQGKGEASEGSNQVAEPFTFEYEQEVAEAVAFALERRATPKPKKQKLFMQTVISNLTNFANQLVPNANKSTKKQMTATERIADYIANKDFYDSAWGKAQDELLQKYESNEDMLKAFEEFTSSLATGTAPTGTSTMIKALAQSALAQNESAKRLAIQSALNIDGAADRIAAQLINDVERIGGIVADNATKWTIHRAAEDYVQSVVADSDPTKLAQAQISKVMRAMSLTMADAAKAGNIDRQSIISQVTKLLTEKWGFSNADATNVAEVVQEQFADMMSDAMGKELKRIYGDKKPRNVKNVQDLFIESIRLGAFDSEIYSQKAAERFFGVGVTIDPDIAKQFVEAAESSDESALNEAYNALLKNVAAQIPPSWIDKFNAWRYLSMLGNPRTHIRNIFGNVGFAAVRLPKDILATGLEYVGSAVSGGKMQRTKAFLNPATNAADRQLIVTAWLDYANAQAAIIGSGTKYKDLPNIIDEMRPIFTSKVGSVFEAASKGNTKLLNFEDRWFSQPAYTLALAGYLKANGISAAEYTSGDANPEVISRAQEYAIREAQKATYRDTNVFSQAISRMRVKPAPADASAGEKALRGVGTVLVEGILPYKKTPANILVRAVEYSPAGLAKYLLYGTVQLARGEMSAAHWMDGLAAGLTGTGLVALGVWLAAEGILMGGEPDDRENLQRYQGYSINLGGRSYTLDWLAPEALPVFVGVELYNQYKAGNGNNAWALIESMKNLAEPVTEMSMLQGVNDMLETASYADDKLSAIAVQSAVSYISQFIPTLSGQIERITEDRRQTTFVDRNSETPTDVQRILGKLFNKLPGEYQQIDYVDAWGRTQETGNAFERLANNLINPAYVNEIQVEKVEDELQRLTDLGESGMFPSRPAMSDQINGEYLTAEQYEKYTKTAGQLKLAVVSDLTSSEVYEKLSDADKAAVIRKAYTYANGVAKLEIDEDAEVESWIIKAKDYGNPSAFLLAKHTLSDIEYEEGKQGAKKEAIAKAINAMPLSRSEKSKLFELLYPTYKNDIEWR